MKIALFSVFVAALLSASAQPTTVIGWGWNNNGQAVPPAGLTNIIAVEAGAANSMALRDNGAVVTWGFPYAPTPAGLTNIRTIACGNRHNLAVRSNGTVVAWGDNAAGQTNVPPGLSNVIAAAGAGIHTLALKSDGTVVAWGTNRWGEGSVPPGLSNVIAVSAGGEQTFGSFSLALKSDGTIVGWGDNRRGQINVPAGLSNVIAISASPFFESLALKSDGTVAMWGALRPNVPPGLTNVVAISAGDGNFMALRADGSLVVWGDNFEGALQVPSSVRNVRACTYGYWHGLAVTRPIPPAWPRITQQPRGFRALAGQEAEIGVTATSSAPLTYQWQFRGQNMPNETNSSVVLPDLKLSDSGDYAVIVTADRLSVRSAPAFLAVSNPPVAQAQTSVGLEDTELLIALEGFDPSGLPLTARIAQLPNAGRLFQYGASGRGDPIDRAPAIVSDPAWRVVYIPGADGNGDAFDQFTFVVSNELGDSAPGRVSIDVEAVNDAPTFVKGPDQTVLEDAGRQTISAWGRDIVAGPANEHEAYRFIVTNDNPALFEVQPAIDAAGTLTFVPARDAYGVANATVWLLDDAGTANGGVDTSASQTFAITVLPVNDAPVAKGQAIGLSEDTSKDILLLGRDVEQDTLTYRITSFPSHGALVGTPPHVTYSPEPNYFGPDSFTFAVDDGQASSAPTSVVLQVLPVNDPPVAAAQLFAAFLPDTKETNLLVISSNNRDALMVFDASLSSDIENDTLEYFWRDKNVPFAAGVRVTNLFEIGRRTIQLQVSDGIDSATLTFSPQIITPGQAVEILLLQLDETDLEHQARRPLRVILHAAIAAYDRGLFKTGDHLLSAFQHKIAARLNQADASALISAAQAIINATRA